MLLKALIPIEYMPTSAPGQGLMVLKIFPVSNAVAPPMDIHDPIYHAKVEVKGKIPLM